MSKEDIEKSKLCNLHNNWQKHFLNAFDMPNLHLNNLNAILDLDLNAILNAILSILNEFKFLFKIVFKFV